MDKKNINNLVLAGLFAAIALLLPMAAFHAFGQAFGEAFLPMHIPVILCGMVCGYKFGGITGFIVPLLSGILTSMPPLYPVAVYMAFELMTYGIVSGLLIKKTNVFVTLIAAMISGRIVLAIAQVILLGLGGKQFMLESFLTESFLAALGGIIIQIILIPTIILILRKLGLLPVGD